MEIFFILKGIYRETIIRFERGWVIGWSQITDIDDCCVLTIFDNNNNNLLFLSWRMKQRRDND